MKKIFFILCCAGLMVSSCNKNNSSDECNGNAAELDGTWKMVTVKDNASGAIISKPQAIKAEVEITFAASGLAKGTLTGNTPTNTIFDSEYITTCDQSFSLTFLNMTKVAENEWGILFVDHIRNATKYSFESNSKLTITTTAKTLGFIRL